MCILVFFQDFSYCVVTSVHNVNVKCLNTTGIIVVLASPVIMKVSCMVCCQNLFIL
jgi:predicted aspartyl protease